MDDRAGKVYLVDVGPGAIDLVTVRAFEAIRIADVIVYDAGVNANLLSRVLSSAESISAAGSAGYQRQDLMRLLIDRARAGKSIVRLYDSHYFMSRSADDASSLAASEIEFEIVPAVDLASAVSAFGAIPLTGDTSVTFLNVDRDDPAPPWGGLAGIVRNHGTLLLSERTTSIRESLARLVAEGLPADTPAAAIFAIARAAQKVVAATLANLAAEIDRARPSGTAVVVIGDRARVQPDLQWFERQPLFGRRIVVTRGSVNSSALTQPLRARGAEVVEFPTIEIVAPDSYDALDAAAARLASFDWVIFTSATGVDRFIDRLNVLGRDIRELGSAKIAAIGPATAARLRRYALQVALQPSEYRAEAIAQSLGAERIRDACFLIPRAQVAREVLPEMLKAQGALAVDVVPCYKTVAPAGARAERMRALIDAEPIDLVVFTSSSTATNFSALLGTAPRGLKAAAIGPITAETARGLGFEVAISPAEYTINALVAAIVDHFQKK
jgi:uroporphyrinogen III methyltransferase/synthase